MLEVQGGGQGQTGTLPDWYYGAVTTTTTTTTTTTSCTCSYSDSGSYYFSPQCCGTGSPISGLPTVYNSGNSICTTCYPSTSGSCCPNISKAYTKCSATDVSSSSSPVYFYCYSTGQCINSSQGAGGTC